MAPVHTPGEQLSCVLYPKVVDVSLKTVHGPGAAAQTVTT